MSWEEHPKVGGSVHGADVAPWEAGNPREPQVRPEWSAITHPRGSHRLSNSEGGFSLLPPFSFPEGMSGLTPEVPDDTHTPARARAGALRRAVGWLLGVAGMPDQGLGLGWP